MATAENSDRIPDHVPRDLVRPYPFAVPIGSKWKTPPQALIPQIFEGPPLLWSERAHPAMGGWIPTRAEDLSRIYQDSENFGSYGQMHFARMIGESWPMVPVELEGAEHQRVRKFLNPLFTPKRMQALEPRMREYSRRAIAAFLRRGKCDFFKEFSLEFPIIIFLEMMGMPTSPKEVAMFLEWEYSLFHGGPPEKIAQDVRNILAYMSEQVADRRKNPKDDIITHAIQPDENGGFLSDQHLRGLMFGLFLGGLDTIANNVSWQVLHLAQNPDHQALLRAHPEMIPNAVEEMLRFYASVPNNRIVAKEVELHGVTMMPGDLVRVASYLACHDPALFDEPEKVKLDRKPRHMAFGIGPHFCIGMHLARLELRVALEEVLAMMPEFSVDPDVELEYYYSGVLKAVTVPLVWKT